MRDLQRVPTGSEQVCKWCSAQFIVERNPNRSGLFCSVSCGRRYSRSRRSHWFQNIENRRREAEYENMLRPSGPARPAANVETPTVSAPAEIESAQQTADAADRRQSLAALGFRPFEIERILERAAH